MWQLLKDLIIAFMFSLAIILIVDSDFVSNLTSFVSPSKVIARPESGTCCPQLFSDCIVGDIIRENKYYKREGPCP